MTELNGELWRDLYYASFDDLRLHVRLYPAPESKARPVVCLPGLTRNGRDLIDRLALALGLVIGPVIASMKIGLDLLWTALIAGTLAYVIHRLREATR